MPPVVNNNFLAVYNDPSIIAWTKELNSGMDNRLNEVYMKIKNHYTLSPGMLRARGHLQIDLNGFYSFYNPNFPPRFDFDFLTKPGDLQCDRCHKFFTPGYEEYENQYCCSHPGKLVGQMYSCCNRSFYELECMVERHHVWNGIRPGMNGPFPESGCLKTLDPPAHSEQGKIFVIATETIYTTIGKELVKVTVLDYYGELVYESYVRPEAPIIDYDTRRSGITYEMLCREKLRDFIDVQRTLMSFIDNKTILVGHDIHDDLRALKLSHSLVVDTALIFLDSKGLPYRRMQPVVLKRGRNKDYTMMREQSTHEDCYNCLEALRWKASGGEFRGFRSDLSAPNRQKPLMRKKLDYSLQSLAAAMAFRVVSPRTAQAAEEAAQRRLLLQFVIQHGRQQRKAARKEKGSMGLLITYIQITNVFFTAGGCTYNIIISE